MTILLRLLMRENCLKNEEVQKVQSFPTNCIKIGSRIERHYVQMLPETGNTLGPKLKAWIEQQL